MEVNTIMSGLLLMMHIALALLNVWDLSTRSQRGNKLEWFFAIACLPFIGSAIYHLTKKRTSMPAWR